MKNHVAGPKQDLSALHDINALATNKTFPQKALYAFKMFSSERSVK